jgi:putative endopeptidase
MRNILLAAVSALAISSTAAFAADPPMKPMYGDWGVDLTAGDKSVAPGADFDKYANGAWAARTEIPADQGSAGVGYDVYNRSQDQLRTLIETAEPSTQIGALYKSFVDEAKVEAVDDKPLKADLAKIAAIKTKADFAVAMGGTQGGFGGGVFSLDIYPDA